jgi:hypothetical protein
MIPHPREFATFQTFLLALYPVCQNILRSVAAEWQRWKTKLTELLLVSCQWLDMLAPDMF